MATASKTLVQLKVKVEVIILCVMWKGLIRLIIILLHAKCVQSLSLIVQNEHDEWPTFKLFFT